jgi:hypothetical protein
VKEVMSNPARLRVRALPALCAVVLCTAAVAPALAAPGGGRQAATASGSAPIAPAADQDLTDAARLLAGLPPSPSGRLAAVAARPEWRTWRQEFDGRWTGATKQRFAQMAEWRERELAPAVGPCSTLMYPFSGPDILNAWLMFPDCDRYVLFGLEQPGSLPHLEQLSADRLARLLEETRHALNNLLARNYFITRQMLEDTSAEELRGTLPLMAVFLVRMNAGLISARDMEIAEDGQLRPRTPPARERKSAPAIELVFARPGRPPQTLVYFRAQAENAALERRPGVRPFLEQQPPFTTFMKSASYLLHGSEFSILRDVLLRRSRLILEDDSGIPLRFLKPPEWSVTLYGKYSKPVKDFNYGYQPDMEKAYAAGLNVKPLTFSFGYHWADGAASVLLAVRSAAPSPHQSSAGAR